MLLSHSQVLVFLQKHKLFLLNLTLRSDLMIPATPGILFQSVVWLPSGTFVELLTRKVKDFSLFQEALIVQRIKQRILEKGWAKIFTKKVVTLLLFSALKKYSKIILHNHPRNTCFISVFFILPLLVHQNLAPFSLTSYHP